MAKVRVGNRYIDGPASVNYGREITTYANQRTESLAPQMGGFNSAKVWFMPGKLADIGFENTAFGSMDGMPDYEKPMARFKIERTNDGFKLTNKYVDNWGEKAKAWKDAVDAENGNHKRARERIASAAIVNSTDIDASKNLGIMNKVLGLQTRNYFLMETVTGVPAPNLVFSPDTYTEGNVAAKVPELQEPKLIAHAESRATNILYKNVGHIAISEEARLKTIHPIDSLRQDKTMRDMMRLINAQIAEILETATSNSGNDWGAIDATYFRSTKKPHDDIQPDVTTIRGNGFNVDFLAMHDRPGQDLSSNDFVKGPGSQTSGFILNNIDHFQIMGLPPVILDQALTATIAIIASKEAVWLGTGPTSVASYNNDVSGYMGWLVKQWWLPYLANTGAIRQRTGVSA